MLPLHAAWATSTEGAVEGKVNVLLAVHSHKEGRHIHDLLAHPTIQSSHFRTGSLDERRMQLTVCDDAGDEL